MAKAFSQVRPERGIVGMPGHLNPRVPGSVQDDTNPFNQEALLSVIVASVAKPFRGLILGLSAALAVSK